ncbi:hypothetical protein B0F90DRAFT_1823678 [Multifurca ochricompacta]|uniref:Uncharacterized protein n=1 Tax=Multifurca ochricompacta TaxID=376703 RepID=A0AAD4QJC3_9AGAM|nr:hypothetical protein B0F90DRAFT_1823678 [Multifurca ochricompacta]
MPVSLVLGDVFSFRKYIVLEISPGKPDQIDALRRSEYSAQPRILYTDATILLSLFEIVEHALKSAVDAGKERSEDADNAFATAEEELDQYAAWYHPKQQSVLGDVQNIIEDAAQKDSYIMKTHNRLSSRLGLSKAETSSSNSLVKVRFQILQSPTERQKAPIVTCELAPEVKVSELLWTFSRLPEDQRITLKQNPHFYFGRDLSDKPPAYNDKFRLEPLRDLRLEKDSLVLILLDRTGQIFLDYRKFSKTYGNIWKPSNTIILKDLQGTLEAANQVSPKINGEVCIWQRGGMRPEEDLSKWTEVLDQALGLPDVDWLIRSETSQDEAFDIEVTGGWERCSPVNLPEPSPVFKEEYPDPATTAPPHDDDHMRLHDDDHAHPHGDDHMYPEDTPNNLAPGFNTLPTISSASEESFHSSDDTRPTVDTVNTSTEELQSNVEEFSPPVEDADFTAPGVDPPLGSIHPQTEVVVSLNVQSACASPGLLTLPVESEPSPVDGVSVPNEITSPSTMESVPPQVEAVHPPVQPPSPPPELLSSPPHDDVVTASSPASSLDEDIFALESALPEVEATHPPVQLVNSTSEPPTVPVDKDIIVIGDYAYTSDMDIPTSDRASLQAETVHPLSQAAGAPPEPPVAPVEDDAASASSHVSRNTAQVESAHAPVQPTLVPPESLIPSPNVELATPGSFPVSDWIIPLFECPTPQVETIHPPIQQVRIPSERPTASLVDNPAPANGAPTLQRTVSHSDNTPPQVKVVTPPTLPEPLTPVGSTPAPASSLPASEKITPPPERDRPQVKIIHAPLQPSREPPEHLVPHLDSSPSLPGGLPSPTISAPPDSIPPSAEAVRPSVQPAPAHLEPPSPPVGSNVTATEIAHAPLRPVRIPSENLVSNGPAPAAVASPPSNATDTRGFKTSRPPLGTKPAPASSQPTSDRTVPPSKRDSPQVETVRPPVQLAPRLQSNIPADNKSTPDRTAPVPNSTRQGAVQAQVQVYRASPEPLLRTLQETQLLGTAQAIRPPVQSMHAPPQPSMPSIRSKPVPASSIPTSFRDLASAERGARSQVQAVRPPVQPVYTPERLTSPTGSKPGLASIPVPERVRPSLDNARPQVGVATLQFGSPVLLRCLARHLLSIHCLRRPPKEDGNPGRTATINGRARSNYATTDCPAMVSAPSTTGSASATSLPPKGSSSAPVARRDESTGASSHTPLVQPPNPSAIEETQGESKGHSTGQVAATPMTSSTAQTAPRLSSAVTAPASAPQIHPSHALGSPEQIAPQLTVRPVTRAEGSERPASSLASNEGNPAPIARQDKTTKASPQTYSVKPSSLATIPEAQVESKRDSIGPSAVPPTSSTAASTASKVSGVTSINVPAAPRNTTEKSSVIGTKDITSLSRQSTALTGQMTLQPSVRSSYQPVARPHEQSVASSPPTSYKPAVITRQSKTGEIHSQPSRVVSSSAAAVSENRGESKAQPMGPTGHPATQVASAVNVSAPPARISAPRMSARVKTKDLINWHKQQNGSDARPLTVVQSLGTPISKSKTSPSEVLQPASLDMKPNSHRIDSGIELWDYDPRRKGINRSSNGDSNSSLKHIDAAVRGPGPTRRSSRSASISNISEERGTRPSPPLKESPTSISESPNSFTSPSHPNIPVSTYPEPEPAQTPPLGTTESPSADPPASALPGRRDAFINRKPQPTTKSTANSGQSTPPRPSTPSSMSHSASVTTSTQATMVTPATSFYIPSRDSSPAPKPVRRSWFRRVLIDPVKSKLGYGSKNSVDFSVTFLLTIRPQ